MSCNIFKRVFIFRPTVADWRRENVFHKTSADWKSNFPENFISRMEKSDLSVNFSLCHACLQLHPSRLHLWSISLPLGFSRPKTVTLWILQVSHACSARLIDDECWNVRFLQMKILPKLVNPLPCGFQFIISREENAWWKFEEHFKA